ncbi:MAG: hypothetical protein KDH88_06865 [Chromatiales bacterium]|nr:hypothetical protein [Chromatiales bacterium]
MPHDNNRLLLEIEKTIRDINRDVINPLIPELGLEDIRPVMGAVARARAAYLKELFDLSEILHDSVPTPEQVKQLRLLRMIYEELVAGAKALETAIQRGYLDVHSAPGGSEN